MEGKGQQNPEGRSNMKDACTVTVSLQSPARAHMEKGLENPARVCEAETLTCHRDQHSAARPGYREGVVLGPGGVELEPVETRSPRGAATRPGQRRSPKNCRGHGGRQVGSSSTGIPRASTLHHRASWDLA